MITRQEMFDRAWRGLKAQGWKRCAEGGACMYYDKATGHRCAWGHVDPLGTMGAEGPLTDLVSEDIGLAGMLSEDDVSFATNLQDAHDEATDVTLEAALRQFASRYGLIVPDEAP